MEPYDDPDWLDALQGLERGDFSRLEPLFDKDALVEGDKSRILDWYERGYFNGEPKALEEALTCACFLGSTRIANFLLTQGVDPAAGTGTGIDEVLRRHGAKSVERRQALEP